MAIKRSLHHPNDFSVYNHPGTSATIDDLFKRYLAAENI